VIKIDWQKYCNEHIIFGWMYPIIWTTGTDDPELFLGSHKWMFRKKFLFKGIVSLKND
jgi:hypothetical protein